MTSKLHGSLGNRFSSPSKWMLYLHTYISITQANTLFNSIERIVCPSLPRLSETIYIYLYKIIFERERASGKLKTDLTAIISWV